MPAKLIEGEKLAGAILARAKDSVLGLRERPALAVVIAGELLKKAEAEGRLDGKFKCSLCGMRYQTKAEAEECCRVAIT